MISIGSLLQRIYSNIGLHPEFRVVRFLTAQHHGRRRVWTSLEAAADGGHIVVDEPRTVLSSSQLNVLAVAIFMSLNLPIEDLLLEIMALDDPLQSFDNVNLLGLVDLLRRLCGHRQVIVSTHDDRLVGPLQRKLRPLGAGAHVGLFAGRVGSIRPSRSLTRG